MEPNVRCKEPGDISPLRSFKPIRVIQTSKAAGDMRDPGFRIMRGKV